ncbi:hypothetical protein GW17_00024563 [Ensete ventricosum]|nr:hypothetical protein GW17_00024563 [Ensete ventricosum]RZS00640.1 hypothetical protein BHM03_00030370 [Ensete ventricosum]
MGKSPVDHPYPGIRAAELPGLMGKPPVPEFFKPSGPSESLHPRTKWKTLANLPRDRKGGCPSLKVDGLRRKNWKRR